jgi:hypothetical protein
MKNRYLIVVAGPKWESGDNNISNHHQKMTITLAELILAYKTSPDILIRYSSHPAPHTCASTIHAKLESGELRKDDRMNIDYEFSVRMERMKKFFHTQTFNDMKKFDLVILVGYSVLTRDLPEYLLSSKKGLRTNGCGHCQAIVLSCEDNTFAFEKYLNIGE